MEKIVELLEVENKVANFGMEYGRSNKLNDVQSPSTEEVDRKSDEFRSYKWVEPAWNIDCTNSTGSPVR